MPREQVQWFTKQSAHDINQHHAQQRCTYYSIVNVNKAKYPFLSSYEQEQTWTLSRTISNNHKRYQSSIENIHLTVPITMSKTKRVDYENIQMKKQPASNSVLTPILSAQKYISSTSLQPTLNKTNSTTTTTAAHQKKEREAKKVPIKTRIYENSNQKYPSPVKKFRPLSKPMRVIHSNGEFVVRI